MGIGSGAGAFKVISRVYRSIGLGNHGAMGQQSWGREPRGASKRSGQVGAGVMMGAWRSIQRWGPWDGRTSGGHGGRRDGQWRAERAGRAERAERAGRMEPWVQR